MNRRSVVEFGSVLGQVGAIIKSDFHCRVVRDSLSNIHKNLTYFCLLLANKIVSELEPKRLHYFEHANATIRYAIAAAVN